MEMVGSTIEIFMIYDDVVIFAHTAHFSLCFLPPKKYSFFLAEREV